ncbi:beta-lactamase family protein, partial [Streptomyces ureilyticus]
MTKSVTSMLIGIALDEGAIKDVTESVTVYCRGLVGSAFDGVTIEHLLDMSSGVGDLVEDYTVRDSLINRFAKAAT